MPVRTANVPQPLSRPTARRLAAVKPYHIHAAALIPGPSAILLPKLRAWVEVGEMSCPLGLKTSQPQPIVI